jgi:hypothetical protein
MRRRRTPTDANRVPDTDATTRAIPADLPVRATPGDNHADVDVVNAQHAADAWLRDHTDEPPRGTVAWTEWHRVVSLASIRWARRHPDVPR